ncbi:winged helix-turn-helix domain-containing protein [Citrobacter amalonaticus]|nr:winged helix-turn-helix domain-containing protein [Citrobacter amalonaticus]
MAIILINNTIEFDEDLKVLKNIETDDMINLSFTSCNLLSLLITHKGDVVSRNEIFVNVFDINGSHTTHNNLNQYISSLRKNIKTLGIEEDVIITIPRIGFMIAQDVILTKDIDPENKLNENSPVIVIPDHIKTSKIVIMFLCLAMSVYACYFLYNINKTKISKETIPVVQIKKTVTNGNCKINIINKDDHLPTTEIENILSDFTSYTKEECQNNTYYYLFRSNIIDARYQKFILKCIGDITKFPGCHSFYDSISGEL